jgi:outer membrane protein OmpA-like peptidoglycan-associated protein
MRKLIIGMALASSFLATPGIAREKAWYIEVDGGAVKVRDFTYDIGTTTGAARVHSKTGFDIGGIIGYDFGGFRLEAEDSYRRASADVLTPVGLSNGRLVTGRTSAFSVMLNGLIDIGHDDGLQAFVGGGAGIARVDARLLDSANSWDDRATGKFAWQALAGFRVPVSEHVDLGMKYRYFNVDNVNLVSSAGKSLHTKWRSHSLMATLAYNFGGTRTEMPVEGAATPPPPPAPPPPPPPPPMAICNKGPYIVFFDWDKSDITAETSTILDSAINAYGNCAQVPVVVAGYAGRSGAPDYYQGLSERRAGNVRGYLSSHGVADSEISTQGFGENNNRVPTADGVCELQNRRVEITYGPDANN